MSETYFVKQPYSEPSGALLASVAKTGCQVPLGAHIVLYQGEDAEKANAVAANLREGVLSSYRLHHDEMVVIHHRIRDGERQGFHSHNLTASDPVARFLDGLVQDTSRTVSIADAFGQFSREEIEFLQSLKAPQ